MTAVRPCKIVECGLEVPRGVVYQGWEPGGEYTKPLVMKNVQLRTQRINYTSVANANSHSYECIHDARSVHMQYMSSYACMHPLM